MKIGYPCINRSIGCTGSSTFRLKSYSDERLIETVTNNLDCLEKMLIFNYDHDLLFFRISSDLVPFASHPVCTFPWQKHFAGRFKEIGDFIKGKAMRVSMHPDQFTLINSPDGEIFERSLRELEYHAQVLDLMELDTTHKTQIHVGGAYGDKDKSIKRFAERYESLHHSIRQRLVVENDDRIFNLQDCLKVHELTGIPVVFDVFHHSLNSSGEDIGEAIRKASQTWGKSDGILIIDYSSQERNGRPGTHAESININHFRKFLASAKGYDFDVMLEIKDKEKSALKAVNLLLVG